MPPMPLSHLQLFDLEAPEHKCSGCGVVLTDSNWQPSRRNGGRKECRDCYTERMKKYYEAKLSLLTKYKHDWHVLKRDGVGRVRKTKNMPSYQELRTEAFRLIAKSDTPRCVYCGCDDMDLLQINHKEGGGQKERRVTHSHGFTLLYAILTGKRITNDLEIVCAPHNTLHYMKLKHPGHTDKFKIIWAGE